VALLDRPRKFFQGIESSIFQLFFYFLLSRHRIFDFPAVFFIFSYSKNNHLSITAKNGGVHCNRCFAYKLGWFSASFFSTQSLSLGEKKEYNFSPGLKS
jgi:hypothetical protein